MEPFDANELYPDDGYESPWDDSDYEDDDPYGCCDSARCLNPNWHHQLSECYTIEDVTEPSRLREFWWTVKFRLLSLVERFRRREPEDEDDLPF